MGAESLNHSERIGDKIKKGVARGMLLTGLSAGSLSAGISPTKELVASATTQSPEVSSKIPTAEQFFLSKYHSLMGKLENSVPIIEKLKEEGLISSKSTVSYISGYLGGGEGMKNFYTSLIPKDETIRLEIQAGGMYNAIKEGKGEKITGAIFRSITFTLYRGSPSQIANQSNPIPGAQDYSFSLIDHYKGGRNWQITKLGFNVAGNQNTPYYQNIGIALTSISSNTTLTSEQMSSVNNLVAQAEATFSAVENGDTLKAVGKVGVNTIYALFPSK